MSPQSLGSFLLLYLATTTMSGMSFAFEIPKSLLKRCHKRYFLRRTRPNSVIEPGPSTQPGVSTRPAMEVDAGE